MSKPMDHAMDHPMNQPVQQRMDKKAFGAYITQVLAFYKQDVSRFTLDVWWAACQPFTLEQVQKAITAHAVDAERGRFAPKPADLVAALAGTKTDKAMLAWGKVHEAMVSVGAYRHVCFDEPAIHAAVDDLGGWAKVCQTLTKDLSYLQHQFCKMHQAYAGRSDYPFSKVLMGEGDAPEVYKRFGIAVPPTVFVGDVRKCIEVQRLGSQQATRIHHIGSLMHERLQLMDEMKG